MDCSLPGSSIHGIFQARVLEWGAIAFSRINHRYIYICPLPLEAPSHFPPHPTHLGCHRVWGLSSLSYSKFPLSILHKVMYMFQCYSFSLPLPLVPPLWSQVCSLCLHLRCCFANRFTGTIFLDSIYVS